MIPKPDLQIVGGTESKLPDPPYPADFKLKKFTFDLDIARVNRSRTWCRCPVEHRPWLLQIWAQSWLSEPPGSWEDDDYIIANAIGMNPETFSALRPILMRGWYLCLDGRLYHPYLVDMIQRIINAREVYRIANERKKNTSKNDDTIELLVSNSSVTSGKKQDPPLPYIPSVPYVPSVPPSPAQSNPPANRGISPSNQDIKNTHVSSGSKPDRKNTPQAAEGVYPESFLQCWQIWKNRLPREGGNSKASAFKQWQARINQGHPEDELYEGTLRYAAYCESAGTVGTRYVKMASTFYGQDRHFQEDWIPAKNGHGNGKPSLAERAQAVIDHFANESHIIDGECYETH